MKMACISILKIFCHLVEISKKVFYFFVSPLSIILLYILINSVVYSGNINNTNSKLLSLSTSEASAAYTSGVFSALSLILLIFNFIYQSKDSKKKDELYLSQQFSQNFNNRFGLYKSLLRNIEGNVVIINEQGIHTSTRGHYVGVPFLDKKLQYVVSLWGNENIVKIDDNSNNVVSICNLHSFDFEYYNEPFYELFSLLQYTCNSKSIPNEEKEIYFERIRNLTKIELVWLLLFCVSNSEIHNNLTLLKKSKVLTKLPSPFDFSDKSDLYFLVMEFLRKNNLITEELFKK